MILSHVFLSCLFLCPSAVGKGTGPVLKFDVQSHDFGTLEFRGEPKEFGFDFVNDGDAPLVIVRTQTSCRCIKVAFPKKPVAPGERGTVNVTYEPDKDLGTFSKGIHIYSNAPEGHQIIVVRGEVVEPAG